MRPPEWDRNMLIQFLAVSLQLSCFGACVSKTVSIKVYKRGSKCASSEVSFPLIQYSLILLFIHLIHFHQMFSNNKQICLFCPSFIHLPFFICPSLSSFYTTLFHPNSYPFATSSYILSPFTLLCPPTHFFILLPFLSGFILVPASVLSIPLILISLLWFFPQAS